MSVLKTLASPVRQYFNPRFEDLVNRLDRAQAQLDALSSGIGAGGPVEGGFDGFNDLLHELRGLELARMPRIDGTMLSAGCSGTLYFDWISRCYGPIDRHIGLELYLPQPDGLPANVEWVKASVGRMDGVSDGSVDLLFSGQNFEHLFGDDAVRFLLESHRVLRPGGWLVIDSPHRDTTSAVGWTMPEHTIEFTPAEARELLELAGFDVVDIRGLWLCRDPRTREVLPLWPPGGSAPGARELVQRCVGAAAHPDDSFVWWAEATRSTREPQIDALRARHAEIFAVAWPERQQRLQNAVGRRHTVDGRSMVSVDAGTSGYALFGPYMPLSPGRYTVSFRLRQADDVGADDADAVAILDVADADGDTLIQRQVSVADLAPAGQWQDVAIDFQVDTLVWGGQFRVFSIGVTDLEIEATIELTEDGTMVAPTDGPLRPADR